MKQARYTHSKSVAIFVLVTSLLPACASLSSKESSKKSTKESQVSYNASLKDYPYPFPVKTFPLNSQRQDLEMAYMHLEGQAELPTVLLLHGKNFSGAYWKTTAEWLHQQGHSVLIPDQVGFGKSSKPDYYQFSFPQLVHNTMKLAEHLKVKKIIVVGHSMGGMLATRFALMHPNRVEKLILLNPIGLEDYLKYVEYKDVQFFYSQEKNKTADDIKNYQIKNYYDGQWKKAYEPWVKMHAGWINGPDWPRVAWNNALTYDMIFSQPVANEFADLKVPTVLIIGTRDRTGPGRAWKKPGVTYKLGQYDQLGKKVVAKIPKGQLYELQGLGHLPHIEDFRAFTKALSASLK